jgi:SAM-dependent methyltransferase
MTDTQPPDSIGPRIAGKAPVKDIMTHPAYCVGGYDWLDTWRQMYDVERSQAEEATSPGFNPQADCWAGPAGRFAAAERQVPQPDSFMRFLLPLLRPQDRVLDIGAGTGRYEPVLAGAVAEVLAVEPSPAMREQLERRVAEERLANVRIIPERWPEADVPMCDVATAAHVLYGVRDIGPFLERMNTVAQRSCVLLVAFRHTMSWVIDPFWRRFRGEGRKPLPGALECLNALYQLGIPAQMTLIPVSSRFSYPDEDEALIDLRWRMRFPAEPERDQAIRALAREQFDRDGDGRLVARGLPQHAAVIWWERETSGDDRS